MTSFGDFVQILRPCSEQTPLLPIASMLRMEHGVQEEGVLQERRKRRETK